MIPDLATLRDRQRLTKSRNSFTFVEPGWNGSHRTWTRYEIVSLVLAGLATPLVLSVHSIVSMDFATSLLPGWHTTIFPPYFVAGAIYSGFGMVLMLLIITATPESPALYHHAPPGQDGQGHHADRHDCELRLSHRVFRRVVWRQHL